MVALEVDGEGVEVAGEDDDAVVGAVPEPVDGSGLSVNEDIFATQPKQCGSDGLQWQSIYSRTLFAYTFLVRGKRYAVRNDPADNWRYRVQKTTDSLANLNLSKQRQVREVVTEMNESALAPRDRVVSDGVHVRTGWLGSKGASQKRPEQRKVENKRLAYAAHKTKGN